MKAVVLPVAIFSAAAAAAAAAQSTTACGAAYIVEACLGTENAKLAGCASSDYVCQCAAYGNILTYMFLLSGLRSSPNMLADLDDRCYNNCPNDPRLHDAAGQKQIFCGYASQFPSATTKAFSAATTSAAVAPKTTGKTDDSEATDVVEATATATATATGGSVAGGAVTGTAAGTGSSAAATITKNAAAVDLVMNTGRVLVAVAGVVVAVL
ncbi:hypothetical protein B0T22DRAFT_276962 [Podospora appendiculata]|uniref:Extracellular membrane protein CFEM domain-containing protein n=1 Tax=Podospora appendiculata TaxID=314037 RepID=A0AAE1C7T1_9PEZI|nr:hypothetical protein B0T22DRAFT_276962 [Podospora appendiculata]